MKPLFIPLKAEYFEAFARGRKSIEFRQYGPGWNERTCNPGRRVVLGRGYSGRRLGGVITAFEVSRGPCNSPAWRDCYGESDAPAACITIELDRLNGRQTQPSELEEAMPATKRKPAAKTRRKPPPEQVIEPRDIPVADVVTSPFQPRTDFDPKEIDRLAKSIEAIGLGQPIVVRQAIILGGPPRKKPAYELIDGERRWRAVKKLKYKTIRAEIGKHTDAQVRALVLASSIHRQELNAIEEARAFEQMIEAGDAKGPTELAKQIGVSQGQVSNRLRLLELPEDWQAKIISHEIPPTLGRELVRYKDHPQLLAVIDKAAKNDPMGLGYQTPVGEFGDLVGHPLSEATRPIDGSWFHGEKTFTPTAEQVEELGIVKLTWGQTTESRATNTKLWDKLQAEFKAKSNGKKQRDAIDQANGDIDRALADRKAKAENGKKTPAAEPTLDPKKLWDWYVEWIRWLIAETYRGNLTDIADTDVILGLLELGGELGHLRADAYWTAALRANAVRVKRWGHGSPKAIDMIKSLGGESASGMFDVCGAFLGSMFFDCDDGPIAAITDERVLEIGKLLELDLAGEFGFQQGGPLTKKYWSMHSKAELIALSCELDVEIDVAGGKDAMIKVFMGRIPPADATEVGIEFPKELKKFGWKVPKEISKAA